MIARFPSQKLYQNQLFSDPSVKHKLLRDLPGIDKVEAAELNQPLIFLDTGGCHYNETSERQIAREQAKSRKKKAKRYLGNTSKFNPDEAKVVVKWAKKLVSCLLSGKPDFLSQVKLGVKPHDIAVVTPYQGQVALISGLLHKHYPSMTIGSVDGLQGQEREVSGHSPRPRRCPLISGCHSVACSVEQHGRCWFLERSQETQCRYDAC